MPTATFELPIFLAEVSMRAEPWMDFLGFFTNSIFMALLVAGLVLFVTRKAMASPTYVPSKLQNGVEFVVEFLYNQVEGVLGPKVGRRAFPLLATLFLFILVSNWFGLLPGVGTIGFHGHDHHVAGPLTLDPADHHIVPFLRPGTADLNLTLGMAAVFMLVWTWMTYKELGVIGFLKHTFGPKGGLKGIIGFLLIFIFFFVGIIELVSILFRPVSLSLRLFGNIYAGENLLHAMGGLGETFGFGPTASFISSVAFQLPFYFLEVLVGLIQAIVFALLCTVYIQLSTSHEEH